MKKPVEPVQPVDPWGALSSLIAGVLLWGAIGWGVAYWTGKDFFTGIGIVLGAALGIVSVWLRYGRPQQQPETAHRTTDPDITTPEIATSQPSARSDQPHAHEEQR